MSDRAPIIGITADAEEAGGYSKLPWYALRQNYAGVVAAAGGVPLILPHESALVGRYLDMIDGLMVTGGAFDVDPALFGAETRHASVTLKAGRTDFELAVLKGALDRDMPVLGICGGQQLLAVVLGGTLIQHIPGEVPGALAHEQPNPRTEPGHTVTIRPDTLLARITGQTSAAVNSAHHQAVKAVPDPVVVNAWTDTDGVIEGIEDPTRRFCLGVQWHPEYAIDPADTAIVKAFLEAAASR
ncbi:gamma-glutamyl-gamma-aminobutyrate hydrolase family protein [Roseospira navarrensis]|uniref:Gamma-glutamyl-gamma-aminobutyrate hydrolase family protein n=1 Tax=Roseospira navarrensis TaxID=140058 RepID=A0A7X1ZC83_9PROT|nr:gamma-glutamyl-gamma-aminobutyrate hydrolase family protein [Roseospira navarrensis]MQX35643.1 gamma-glutamyl-gamma-aminobutyrate hydrolase family protein [Roseospira navarrensis]